MCLCQLSNLQELEVNVRYCCAGSEEMLELLAHTDLTEHVSHAFSGL